jgi:hypothetical protein
LGSGVCFIKRGKLAQGLHQHRQRANVALRRFNPQAVEAALNVLHLLGGRLPKTFHKHSPRGTRILKARGARLYHPARQWRKLRLGIMRTAIDKIIDRLLGDVLIPGYLRHDHTGGILRADADDGFGRNLRLCDRHGQNRLLMDCSSRATQ